MSTLFTTDLRREQLLQRSLDRCYSRYGIEVARCSDDERQRQGIDAYLSKDGHTFAVDEKAQLHYIGESLSTFALEIDLLKDGILSNGWLFDPTKATEVYSFVFDIRLHGGETMLQRWTQVRAAHIILVSRPRLIAVLEEVGLDRPTLDRFSKELRGSTDKRRTVRTPAMAVVISRQLEEQPVNLLVKRSFLSSIGQTMVWETTRSLAASMAR